MREKFLIPSIQDDFEIVSQEFDQECSTAEFYNHGWKKTTIRKVEFIINAIKENWGKIFIFSDPDIQFFKPIKQILLSIISKKNLDLAIQLDKPKNSDSLWPNKVACTGFFICKGNEKNLRLWEDIKLKMITSEHSDQASFNLLLSENNNPYQLEWEYLPIEFFGGGTLTGIYWKPGKSLPVPENIAMHHANWTVGVPNKIKQLEYVKNVVELRKKHN